MALLDDLVVKLREQADWLDQTYGWEMDRTRALLRTAAGDLERLVEMHREAVAKLGEKGLL